MKIAIIGAGLSGLTLGSRLSEQYDVTVLEKARGPGGRMSTRRADPFAFDHGAQYFTAESDAFLHFLEPLKASGLVQAWPKEITCLGDARLSSKQKWTASPGMNGICKHLSDGLDLRVQVHVDHLQPSEHGWIILDKTGAKLGPFDWVVSTAPSPQTAALMPGDFAGQSALKTTRMLGCFSLMLGFDAPLNLPWTAMKSGTPPIGWMAVNSSKPGRSSPYTVLIQSDNEWAETHLEDDQDAVHQILLNAASDIAGTDLSIARHQALHRWRYAATKTPAGMPFLIDPSRHLAACGDWCLGGKVESAFLSASQLADEIVSLTEA